jgi:hypothetical protein
MQKIQEIVLVSATKGAGRVMGRLIEGEILRHYIRAISDELDNSSIRHRIADDTRPWEFVISCGLGWHEGRKEANTNRSKVWIASNETSILGSLIAEALSHWGQTYISLDHKSCRPVVKMQDNILFKGQGGIHIEPFQINAHNGELYAQRLEQLGRDIGRCLADYAIKGSPGIRIKPMEYGDFPRPLKIHY